MVRTATVDDLDRLVQMGQDFRRGHWRGVLLQNKAQVRRYVRFLLTAPSTAILVEDRAGTLLGMFGVEVQTHPMSGETIAVETVYWVEPQARKGRAALRLILAAKDWARRRGATKLFMGAPDAKVGTFYEKLNGRPVETLYQFVLEAA